MANYRAARALADKGRNAGEGAAGLSKSSAKKAAVNKRETKEVTAPRPLERHSSRASCL